MTVDLNIELKFWQPDVRQAIIDAAAKALPQVEGYKPEIDSMPYYSGPIVVRLVKTEDTTEGGE